MWYPKDSPFQLEAYSDSDYAGSHGDRQFLGRRLISWQCKKQTIVATSSTEAEYVAAASCCAQVLWIQNQLLDYGFNFMNTKIFIDNQSTICIVKNPVFHQRTKHIEIRHHFIRDANEKNLIQVLKIHTNDNVADLLTKAFDGPRFEYLVVHIGMVVNTAARCTFFLLTGLVSAGRTMVLLVVILSAGRLVSAGRTMVLLVVILSAGRLVSAGRTMILLVVILPAGCFVSAGSYYLCCWTGLCCSESESDDDMETYIPPLPYGAFKDWEIVRCPLSTTYYHVYYQENRRQKSFFYLKQLLPHVYREDLLLLRRRMNRYFRLNPDVDVGLDLWRDVNLLCQSLHSDDVEDFWRTQDDWIVSSWKLYPKSSVHVLDLTNGKTVYMFVDRVYPIRATLLERMLRHKLTVPPSYCRDVVVAGNIIQTVQAGLRESYECLASAPISPWLTANKESGSPLQTALVCNSNPLMVARLPKPGCVVTNSCCKDWKLLFFNVAACFVAAGYLVSAVVPAGSSSSIPADYVSAGHVLVSADRDRIC
ncbi:hypothetical protein Tco_1062681 [Tanacetum coccineum]